MLSFAAVVFAALLAGCGSSTSPASSSGSAAKGTTANAADKAFIAEIIPNDRLAVAMARLAKAHAQRPQLRVFADRIIAADGAQIPQVTAVAKALGVTPAPMKPAVMTGMENDSAALGIQMYQMGMDQVDPTKLAAARPFDRTFLTMMASDLGGAINISRGELAKGVDPQLRPVATTIVAAAETGVENLKRWHSMWYGKGSHASMKGMKGMKGMSGMKGMGNSHRGQGTTTTGTSGMRTTTSPSGG